MARYFALAHPAWIFTFTLAGVFVAVVLWFRRAPALQYTRHDLRAALGTSAWALLWECTVEVAGFYAGLWFIVPRGAPPADIVTAALAMGLRFYAYHLVVAVLYFLCYQQGRVSPRRLSTLVVAGMISLGATADLCVSHLDIFPLLDPVVWAGLELGYFGIYHRLRQRGKGVERDESTSGGALARVPEECRNLYVFPATAFAASASTSASTSTSASAPVPAPTPRSRAPPSSRSLAAIWANPVPPDHGEYATLLPGRGG